YCASKYGVRGFTQALALELPTSIKIYCVNPDGTATQMTQFQGVDPSKVADVILKTAQEILHKKSGDDVDLPEYT
ncbi:MAG: SDR family NAD(P)-dependent oxidoreductase, partial [Candidatus Woesearchaeota archaeon]|nr:SDR family NAD(P)-dependent oxidoreductase [Candidatus Woesearchaeota archaeon]